MRFSKNIIRSFVDLPGKTSMIIYSIGCNLNCYECFVYEALITHPQNIITEEEIFEHIKKNGFLFDSLIISGGEFLINDMQDIVPFLSSIRAIFDGLMIINTNGTYPEKVETLLKNKLIDGIHLDLKLPPVPIVEQEVIEAIYGVNINLDSVLKTAQEICKNNSPYSQFRTVQYPILGTEYFDLTNQLVDIWNKTYNSNIKWYLNPFIDKEASSD